ncbi:hypothetical protein LAZ67_9002593 [Cordylochernes scorpioides]|uniref:Uncharacterized protein n=1 Tax=Cordylochernes scorpioides TaxID=51811 RepID=A0ABY6KTX1_9ARAC|nr:hypothetical protein LAZ67_9002593 [Cordylochernes scorpioides]
MEYNHCSSCIPGLGALTGYYQPGQLSLGCFTVIMQIHTSMIATNGRNKRQASTAMSPGPKKKPLLPSKEQISSLRVSLRQDTCLCGLGSELKDQKTNLLTPSTADALDESRSVEGIDEHGEGEDNAHHNKEEVISNVEIVSSLETEISIRTFN